MKRYHCRYADVFPAEYGAYYSVDEVDASLTASQARIEELTAELAAKGTRIGEKEKVERIEDLERMVVWCAKSGVWYGSNIMRGYLLHTLILDDDGDLCGDDRIDCDGTPASILAAVAKAMEK